MHLSFKIIKYFITIYSALHVSDTPCPSSGALLFVHLQPLVTFFLSKSSIARYAEFQISTPYFHENVHAMTKHTAQLEPQTPNGVCGSSCAVCFVIAWTFS
jgi:hypothetical protein